MAEPLRWTGREHRVPPDDPDRRRDARDRRPLHARGRPRARRARSVVAAFGCTLGVVPHMLAAITGLAALLHTSAVAFQVLKYLGVAYLLFMAWSMLRDKSELAAAYPRRCRRGG